MVSATEFLKHIATAAKMLDKVKHSWAKEIDPGRLNMTSLTDCILGQLFGSYSDGWDKLVQAGMKNVDPLVFIEIRARKPWEREIKKRLKKK